MLHKVSYIAVIKNK